MKPAIAACLVGLCVAVCSWITFSQSLSSLPRDLEFQLIDGNKLTLTELQSRPLVVTFWATTCAVCIKKTPELVKLYQDLHPLGAEMIAVAMAYDPPNRILDYSKLYEIPYPISLDLDSKIAMAFDDVALTPSTFVIDTNGDVVFSRVGNIDIDTLRQKVVKLLDKQPVAG